jgi:hypothetical protein
MLICLILFKVSFQIIIKKMALALIVFLLLSVVSFLFFFFLSEVVSETL